ncbi:MAG: 30S ribosomal protein S5 [Candidatus Buchananbacteria bacterium]
MAEIKAVNKENSPKRGRRSDSRDNFRGESEYQQSMIDIARVTRVMAGGKRMRFRACLVIGDKKGKVGMGVAKGADVTLAVNKAFTKAKKNLITVPIINETIPHRVDAKFGAAKIMLKPAPKGTGIMAGGAARIILDLAGVSNVVAKVLGSNNKINNVSATLKALQMLKKIQPKVKPENKSEAKKPVAEKKSKE